MSFDLNAWYASLATAGNLSQENLAQIQQVIGGNPQVVKFLEGSQLRQEDYSRKMGEWKAKQEETDAYVAKLNEWEGEVKTTLTQYEQEIEALKGGQQVIKPQPPATTGINPDALKNFVSREETENALKQQMMVNAKLLELNNEHRKLYGQDLPNPAEVLNHAMTNGKSLDDAWGELHKVSDRRAEIAEQAVQQRIDAAVVTAKQNWIANNGIPGSSANTVHNSPILATIGTNKSVGQHESTRNRVAGAVNAYIQKTQGGG